jgi:hypothetical protein
MLTGKIKPTLEDAYIQRISVVDNINEARNYLGYFFLTKIFI